MTPTQVIKHFGDDKKAAAGLGKTVPCIRQWVHNKKIPIWSQYAIQAITNNELVAGDKSK